MIDKAKLDNTNGRAQDPRKGWQIFVAVALGILAGVVAAVGAIAVIAAGFTLSFDAIRAVGRAAHMRSEWAWLFPVSVDGAMAVATVAAVVLHRLTGKHAVYPWMVVLAGAGISVACNGLHATGERGEALTLDPEVRFTVSTLPAVMLTLSVHLLVILIDVAARKVERPTSPPSPPRAPLLLPSPSPLAGEEKEGWEEGDVSSPVAEGAEEYLRSSVLPPAPVSPAPSLSPPVPVSSPPARSRPGRGSSWPVAEVVRVILDGGGKEEALAAGAPSPTTYGRVRQAVALLREDPHAAVPPAWKVPDSVAQVIREMVPR